MLSDSNNSSDDSGGGPSSSKRAKNKSYKQKFRPEWLKNKDFSSWLREYPKNPFKAKCSLCNTTMQADISVLKRHNAGSKHQSKVTSKFIQQPIVKLLQTSKSHSEEEKAKYAELKLAAFMAEHKIPHSSMDHLSDLLVDAFPDSNIAKNMKMKHTKLQQDEGVLFDFLEESKKRKLQNCQILKHQPDYECDIVQLLSLHYLSYKFNAHNDCDKFINSVNAVFTEENVKNIERLTREQYKSSAWFELRYARITASTAFDVSRCKTSDGDPNKTTHQLSECLFCVASWDFEENHHINIVPIKYNDKYMKELLDKLTMFWKKKCLSITL
ncbi:hypothetical protein SFRURICE_002513 [Spodoptera frugiperda]|nr:hypothetical protein SFRURICE_002513 [Spodoptera frugiperda]